MFSAKLTGVSDSTYGDQEKDASSLLIELDKGLRSAKRGEQCEAIVRFPRLFEKYPFPILINSAFLKLADLFRVGSNFLRQCILKVTQQSQKHLDKILNVDEFLRRVYSVIHSNDPVARAITYRTLGEAARIISERKNVHHSIINGLDSHDVVEQQGAVFAASCFAAQSRSFASSICGKLDELIQELATPMEMKLCLIPIFQHMHHQAETTRKVLQICTETLLPSYPSRSFTKVTLHTMSQLTAKSLIGIPQQVALLSQYLQSDSRRSVRSVGVRGLLLLAQKSPHMWSDTDIQTLCQIGKDVSSPGLMLGILRVLTTLAESRPMSQLVLRDGAVLDFCTQCCYDPDVLVSCHGAKMYQTLLKSSTSVVTEEVSSLTERIADCATVLEMQILLTAELKNNAEMAQRICMTNVVEFCGTRPDQTEHFVDTLLSAITADGVTSDARLGMCHCLAALASNHGELMPSISSEILESLNVRMSDSLSTTDRQVVVALLTLLFQANVAGQIAGDAAVIVKDVLERLDGWTAYKIARQATRYGHHSTAVSIFNSLANQVSSELYNFWLTALRECCNADMCLQGDVTDLPVTDFVRRVSQAEIHYHNAISSLKAASTPSYPLDFQVSYIEQRASMLQLLTQLIQVCCSFQTSPPPAIATSLAMTTGQDFHRCRHVINQLKKIQKSAVALSEAYNSLLESSFDADAHSLNNIQILQEMCQLVVHVLESVFVLSKRETATASLDGLPTWKSSRKYIALEYQTWESIRTQVLEILHKNIPTPSQATLTHYHVNCIEQMSKLICSRALCLPRYFYQRLQSTSIKLALSPQPRAQNEPLLVHYDTSFTLKVEGVIQHGRECSIHRVIRRVHIKVSSQQKSKDATSKAEDKSRENPTNEMQKVAEPHNEYFSCTLLLAFPVTGLHSVTLTTSAEDDTGATWCMGSPITLLINSYDEAAQRQQQQQYAAQRQQQRAALVAGASN